MGWKTVVQLPTRVMIGLFFIRYLLMDGLLLLILFNGALLSV